MLAVSDSGSMRKWQYEAVDVGSISPWQYEAVHVGSIRLDAGHYLHFQNSALKLLWLQ